MFNVKELEKLLINSNLQQIENTIADKLSCELYKDNTSLITGIIKDEVDASMLSLQDIESFINNYSEKVIEFGLKFLRSYKVQGLSIGIGIKYSIYLIYLKGKDEKELLEYLKKRRIPKPQKLLEQLMAIKKEMSI